MRESGFWGLLGDSDRQALRAEAQAAEFEDKSLLCLEGQRSSDVFILLRGWVKIITTTGDGRDTVTGLHGPGEVVGDIAQAAGYRTATVQALGPVRALVAGAGKFRGFLDSHPEAAQAHARSRAEYQKAATVPGDARRLAFLLFELAGGHGQSADMGVTAVPPLSQEELASLTGLSRAAVTRALREWRARGIIATRQRPIMILDNAALRRIAGAPPASQQQAAVLGQAGEPRGIPAGDPAAFSPRPGRGGPASGDEESLARSFIADLRKLRSRAGQPSYASLERLSGHRLKPAAMSDVLNGNRSGMPGWEFVEAFVVACIAAARENGLDAGALGTILVWGRRWDRAANWAVDSPAPVSDVPPASVPYADVPRHSLPRRIAQRHGGGNADARFPEPQAGSWMRAFFSDGEDGSAGGGGGSGGRTPGEEDYGSASAGRRYLQARCPDIVPAGRPFSLIASINQASTGTAALLEPFGIPPEGRDVLLVLHAPGLRITGEQRLTVHVPAAGDSRPVMFELRADEEGPRSVSITAWVGGKYLGELLVEITADRDRAHGRDREYRTDVEIGPGDGDVSLVVRYDPESQAYRFEFRDEDNPCEVVSRLSFEPRRRIESLVAGLDRLASGRSGYSAGQAREYLVNAGAELWRELVPLGLREQFWERQHRIRQLTILADKDTVPWELLYPRDPGRDAGFLVEQFPVTRSIFGRRPVSRLSLRPARFVLPGGSRSPAEAEAEIGAMRRLLDAAGQPGSVVSDLDQLLDLIRHGDFGLLHFACHNRFEPDDDASITLGGVQFSPRFMTTAVIDKVLARSAPTVFINACRTAGLAPTYNRLDGWASKFLEAGAGAFIGSLWAVSDGTAREFAEELYGQMMTGVPLGKAMMEARARAATHADDPTWLAYSAYGNPQAAVARP